MRLHILASAFISLCVLAIGLLPNIPMADSAPDPGTAEPPVALVTLLFGQHAAHMPWLPVFAKSAANSGVDYFIVGDPAPPLQLPSNMHHIHITYAELVARISDELFGGRKLGMAASDGYKVIDVKPLIGYLFRDQLAAYEWWGHIDNDMIMGDVRKYITKELLDRVDVIPGIGPARLSEDIHNREKFGLTEGQIQTRTWGPFTMYRNVPEVTEMFREIPDLFNVYNNEKSLFVDEWGGDTGIAGTGFKYSMSKMVNSKRLQGKVRVHEGGILVGWDKDCTRNIHRQKERCAECTLRKNAGGRSELIWNRSVFTDPGAWPAYEVAICHFQFGKKEEQMHRASAPSAAALMDAEAITYGFNEGFQVLK